MWVGAAVLVWLVVAPSDAPGTVQQQRERLPPPANCSKNDVEGYWKSHQYNPRFRDWVEFTLEIRRGEGGNGELEGTIKNHMWKGGPKHEQPGMCGAGVPYRAKVHMEAKGTYKSGEILFRGTKWKLDQLVCGKLPFGWGYNLDSFTGKVDFARQEFQSVNNDGGRSVNEPTVFRRVGCIENGPPASVDVKPPALYPDQRGKSGCDCLF